MEELRKWHKELTYSEAKIILQENLAGMTESFIAAGYYLKYIRDNELFRQDGYDTIWEFAEDNYGIKKSTASRWMSMNDKFSECGNSPVLADGYQEFGKSQLQEMLYLTDEQMEQAKPEMTAKEIREIRKQEAADMDGEKTVQPEQGEPEEAVAPAQQEKESEPEKVPQDEPMESDVLEEENGDLTDLELLQKQADEANKLLDDMENAGFGDNDIVVRRQKLLVAALAGYLCDLDAILNPPEEPEQPELPKLKNNDQRKEFLSKYKAWPVWFEVPEAAEVYHRFDLEDGSSIVICEYHTWASWKEKYIDENPDLIGTRKYLLKPGYKYLFDCASSESLLVEHLKNVQKGGANKQKKCPAKKSK